MVISYSEVFLNYPNSIEIAKIKEAAFAFQHTIEMGSYAQDFANIRIEIDVDDNAQVKGESVPAVSPVDSSARIWIRFNVAYCTSHEIDQYLALLAHEIGHMYPTWQICKDELFADLKNQTEKFIVKGILNPRKELVADYYASILGFHSCIVDLRTLTDSRNKRFDEYMEALESYKSSHLFRKKACAYFNN